MIKKVFLVLTILLAAVSAFAFLSCYISPASFWLSGFLSLLTPVMLLLNLLVLIVWLFLKKKYSLVPALALLIGLRHVFSTVSFHSDLEKVSGNTLAITNYNVRIFNCYSYLRDSDYASSKGMIRWLENSESDILCLQEYYNLDSSDIFNVTERLRKKFNFQYQSNSVVNRVGAEFGMVIFSKHPIINTEVVFFEDNHYNKALVVDILLNEDTIKVYNLHLQSIYINEDDVFAQETSKYKSVARSLKKGFVERSKQVDSLLLLANQSKYPVIICGDFNDTPYSYTYQRFESEFKNAFETRGSGFGITYNGRIPFLRIDHQFYGKGLTPIRFTTHDEVDYSDHFPLSATYQIQTNNK